MYIKIILFSRSIDHDAHTFVVHYNTYNSDATLHIDGVLPLGELENNVKQCQLTLSEYSVACSQEAKYGVTQCHKILLTFILILIYCYVLSTIFNKYLILSSFNACFWRLDPQNTMHLSTGFSSKCHIQ